MNRDEFDRHFDRGTRAAGVGIVLWFVFCAVMSLVMTGVLVWAIVELVQWVTTK